jgi:hypothetical protein
MSKRNLALVGATLVSQSYTSQLLPLPDVMPQYIDAFGFIFLRVGVQPFYFGWLVVYAQRKIDLGDFRVLLPPLFLFLTCLLF